MLLVCISAGMTYFGDVFNHQEQVKMFYLSPEGTGGLIHLPYFFSEYFTAVLLIISFGRNLLFFMNFIPVSVLITLDLARFFGAKFIEWDVSLLSVSRAFETKVRDSEMVDELGQVSYVIADKTGTITQNHLMFRKMSIAG